MKKKKEDFFSVLSKEIVVGNNFKPNILPIRITGSI